MGIKIGYDKEDCNLLVPIKDKNTVKHLVHLSSTLEVINYFGLQEYPYDQKINRLANTLMDCLYLIKTFIPDKK